MFSGSENSNEIYNLKYLMHAVITVEPKRKKQEILQCTARQTYGHTKKICRLNPRCHKCAGSHHFSECQKKKEKKPKCVHCSQDNPA